MIAWHVDPSVYLGLAVLAGAHLWLGRRRRLRWRRRVYFWIGLLITWAALESPLDGLGDTYLQTAHMAQHMLLVSYAPPLLLLGLDQGSARWLLDRIPALRRLTEPLLAIALYATAMIGWHVPWPYDFALHNGASHIAEHLTFLVVGLLFWWQLIQPTSSVSRRPLGDAMKIVYIFAGMLPMMAVSLPLLFSHELFYPPYAHAPRILSFLTPVVDQNLAGAVMMAMDMAVLVGACLVIFWRMVGQEVEADLRRMAESERWPTR